MWKIFRYTLMLFVIEVFNGNGCRSSLIQPQNCNCENPIYVDKPTDIRQCYPRMQFQNQVHMNFNRIYNELLFRNIGVQCDLRQYIQLLRIMQSRLLHIINAFYTCTEIHCTTAVSKAIADYATFRTGFIKFTRCTNSNLSPECARLIFEVRPLAFRSAENIISSMTQCTRLKRQQSPATILTRPNPLIKRNVGDCNCVEISTRPIAHNEAECFSPEFIARMKNFVTESWNFIDSAYNNSNPQCDYSSVTKFYSLLEDYTIDMVNVLEDPNPTFAELDVPYQSYFSTFLQYAGAVSDYILAEDKTCYFVSRKVRTLPLSIGDWTYSVVMKCVGYKDVSGKIC